MTENPCSKCKIGKRQHNGWCSPCNKAWATIYRKSAKSKEYHSKWNKEAGKEYFKKSRLKYTIKNPEIRKKYHFKYKYGISLEERNGLLAKQNFKCAACDENFKSFSSKDIHTDHCHIRGEIRGILCAPCNMALGMMKENSQRIMRLAAYAARIKATK